MSKNKSLIFLVLIFGGSLYTFFSNQVPPGIRNAAAAEESKQLFSLIMAFVSFLGIILTSIFKFLEILIPKESDPQEQSDKKNLKLVHSNENHLKEEQPLIRKETASS